MRSTGFIRQPGLSVLLMLLVVALLASPAAAQDGDNLLTDGSFEGEYPGRGRSDLNVPAGWNIWFAESPRNEYWMNLPPVMFPHIGPDPDPRTGARAVNMVKDYATFTAAMYQQVTVGADVNLRARVYAWLRTCNLAEGEGKCASSSESNAYVRIGIDPNGGTDPNDGDIVWSGNATPHDRWGEVSVDATSTGDTVTVFLYTTQPRPSDLNRVYWDDARLTREGEGGSAGGGDGGGSAPPPPPAEVPFVSAQGERDDGSIVHVVQPGDTIDSIAVAYGLSRDDILERNDIIDPRIIQIGQELIIQRPTRDSDDDGDADEEGDAGDSDSDSDTGDSDAGDSDGDADDEREGDDESDSDSAGMTPQDAPPAPVLSVASGEVLPALRVSDRTASICVLLFDDANQNRIQEDGEGLLGGATISLLGDGSMMGTYETTGSGEPYCFDDLGVADYTAIATAPTGYGLTTPDQLRVQPDPGGTVTLAFGAAEGVAPPARPPADSAPLSAAAADDVAAADGNLLADNIGLIVFGLAGVVLIGGLSVSLLLRR